MSVIYGNKSISGKPIHPNQNKAKPKYTPIVSVVIDFIYLYLRSLKSNIAKPNREHVFHIIFPETWTQNDIINHFRKYGPVQIRWIDSSSAFVALINRENSTILLKTIERTKNVKVSTFSTYLRVTGADEDDDVRINAALCILSNRIQVISICFCFYFTLSRMKWKKRRAPTC